MKAPRAILSLLLCFVFLESQALAAHSAAGGGTPVSVVGTYAGALLPDTAAAAAAGAVDNTLGIFSLVVPENGLSTGGFLVFANGQTFIGTINGLADPDTARVLAVLQATFDFTIAVPSVDVNGNTIFNEVNITATAVGNLDATVLAAVIGTASLGRISGTAHLDVNFGQIDPIDFSPIVVNSFDLIVDGFKQSNVAIAATTTFGGGTRTGGGNGGNGGNTGG
jgi:hypothetical protein